MKKSLFLLLLAFMLIASCGKVVSLGDLYEQAIEQMNGSKYLADSTLGKNVKVGILDAGFYHWDSTSGLSHILQEGRLMFTNDYLNENNNNSFFENSNLDDHGTMITFLIAGQFSDNNDRYGLGRNALFYLARTENVEKDFRGEEKNIETALNDLWNRGVQVVNVSLGYSFGFENESEDYSPTDMDGSTASSTLACQKFAEKGLIIVTGSGNDGNIEEWKTLAAPGDSRDVITVGSTLSPHSILKAPYSGVGNESGDYIKPDVVCYSPVGNSFTTPIITGLVTAMLGKDSTLTPSRVKEILHKSESILKGE